MSVEEVEQWLIAEEIIKLSSEELDWAEVNNGLTTTIQRGQWAKLVINFFTTKCNILFQGPEHLSGAATESMSALLGRGYNAGPQEPSRRATGQPGLAQPTFPRN